MLGMPIYGPFLPGFFDSSRLRPLFDALFLHRRAKTLFGSWLGAFSFHFVNLSISVRGISSVKPGVYMVHSQYWSIWRKLRPNQTRSQAVETVQVDSIETLGQRQMSRIFWISCPVTAAPTCRPETTTATTLCSSQPYSACMFCQCLLLQPDSHLSLNPCCTRMPMKFFSAGTSGTSGTTTRRILCYGDSLTAGWSDGLL